MPRRCSQTRLGQPFQFIRVLIKPNHHLGQSLRLFRNESTSPNKNRWLAVRALDGAVVALGALGGLGAVRARKRETVWQVDPETGQIVSSYYRSRYRLHQPPHDDERRELWRRGDEPKVRAS